jgi:hypothetical protein
VPQPKYRQIRLRITGGGPDVQELANVIKAYMARDGLGDQPWELTWDEFDSFGEVGPLRKATLGFTSK